MSKLQNTAVALTVLVLCVCLWFVLHAAGQGKPVETAAAGRANDDYRRLLDQQEASLKRADALMQAQEETHKQVVRMYTKMEELLKRQEEGVKRYEKILETWERQQQQYQTYLDSLGKK
jgi:multidrug efflux pump subunit AcrA (membrane-fusion protein)